MGVRFSNTRAICLKRWNGRGISAQPTRSISVGLRGNLAPNPHPDHEGIGIHVGALNPERKDTHQRGYLCRPEPARLTYAWLAGLTKALRRIGAEVTGKRILVGDIFDVGPEFAISKFKYEWHPEILGKGALFGGQFVSCEAILDVDDRLYVGYPKGIPAGTPFGAFLGRQTRRFYED